MTDGHGEPARLTDPRIAGPFLLVALIWGSTWLVIKDQVGVVPPAWSVTWRFLIAGIAMAGLALVRGESLRLDRRGLRLALVIGPAQFAMNFQLVYQAERHLTSGIVAVLYALLLVPNSLLAALFVGQKLTRGFLAGSAIAIAGIALLLLHEYRVAPPEGQVLLGLTMALGGMLCASATNVLQSSPAARGVPTLPMLAWAMLAGALLDAGIAWAVTGPPQVEWRWGYFAGIGYLAVFGSVVTFPLYFSLLQKMGAGRAAYNGVLVPVIAMALSTAFEGYRWTLLAVAGSALAMAGLVVALRARR